MPVTAPAFVFSFYVFYRSFYKKTSGLLPEFFNSGNSPDPQFLTAPVF